MLISKYFLPIRKEIPTEAVTISHQLMLKSGMIKQIASGLYAWLPFGYKILRRFEQVIREEMDRYGFQELLMPTIQPAKLWHESGRGQKFYGPETLRFKDRHDNEMLYGPTAEEVVTFIATGDLKSYKQLPLSLYNMQWKFRDEIRPRFGIMRSREFLMLDSYSFDKTEEDARKTYYAHYDCFLSICARLGLVAIPSQADSGEIGGDMSHEFHILAKSGESEIFYEEGLADLITEVKNGNLKTKNIEEYRNKLLSYYIATDEKHNPQNCNIPAEKLKSARGIEVGHVFYFADKYSKPMGLRMMDDTSTEFIPMMGSYGIGVGRLVAAFIEANSDDKGIIWNKETSPFDLYLVNLSPKDETCTNAANEIYQNLQHQNFDILFDDTQDSPGVKLAKSELLGIPITIVVSTRNITDGKIEVRLREKVKTEIIELTSLENFLKTLF